MKSEELSTLSLEELNVTKKKSKSVIFAFAVVWGFLVGAVTFLAVMKGKQAISFIPIIFALPVVFLPAIMNLSRINKEIKSRDIK